MKVRQDMQETPVKCNCGKLVAKWRDGKLYVWCKSCRREYEIPIPKSNTKDEPLSRRN